MCLVLPFTLENLFSLAGCARVDVLLASQVEADGEVGVGIHIPVEFSPASTFSPCSSSSS